MDEEIGFLAMVDEELSWRGISRKHEANSFPFQPVAHRPIVDVHRREALDDDAIRFIDDGRLSIVEFVNPDLSTGIGQQAQARFGIPGERFHLAANKVVGAESLLWSGRSIDDERSGPASGPAPDPNLSEVADVIRMQVCGKIGRYVLVWDFQSGEIRLRS